MRLAQSLPGSRRMILPHRAPDTRAGIERVTSHAALPFRPHGQVWRLSIRSGVRPWSAIGSFWKPGGLRTSMNLSAGPGGALATRNHVGCGSNDARARLADAVSLAERGYVPPAPSLVPERADMMQASIRSIPSLSICRPCFVRHQRRSSSVITHSLAMAQSSSPGNPDRACRHGTRPAHRTSPRSGCASGGRGRTGPERP